jgi:hypothetical protein
MYKTLLIRGRASALLFQTLIKKLYKIFCDIFKNYLKDHGKIKGVENQCPDKLEPK